MKSVAYLKSSIWYRIYFQDEKWVWLHLYQIQFINDFLCVWYRNKI